MKTYNHETKRVIISVRAILIIKMDNWFQMFHNIFDELWVIVIHHNSSAPPPTAPPQK